jgi:SAM-dependent methyltransferase
VAIGWWGESGSPHPTTDTVENDACGLAVCGWSPRGRTIQRLFFGIVAMHCSKVAQPSPSSCRSPSGLIRGAVALAALLAAATASGQATEELDTPFVTTPDNVVQAMLDIAGVGRGDRLLDLGSGDGRIVIAAARRGAVAHGIEIDPRLVAGSRDAARRAGVEARATFATNDLFETDVSHADVVTMYLLPDVNRRLSPRLFAALRPGARIVSHDYDLGGWPPDATMLVEAPDKAVDRDKTSRVHFWRVPARVDGRWRGRAGDAPIAVEFRQDFQHVSGTVRWAGRDYTFADRKIDGRRLELRATAPDRRSLRLTLRALGDRIVGRLDTAAGSSALDLAR